MIRVYKKDARLELRSPSGIFAVLLFALILAILYHYSMSEEIFLNSRNLFGVTLATLFFSSTITPGRNISFEKEGGALRIMSLSPADSAGYYAGKVIALWQLQMIFIFIYVPLYILLLTGRSPLLAFEFRVVAVLLLVLALAAATLCTLGIMMAYISSGNRLKDLLLPLLILPASLPVFMIAINAMEQSIATRTAVFSFPYYQVGALVATLILYTGIGMLMYSLLSSEE